MQITIDKKGLFILENSIKTLKTPFFFPAISTIKTNSNFYDYFTLLKKVGYPGFLVSSYDIYNHKNMDSIIKEISSLTESNIFILMDSGNYEAYWNKDNKWSMKTFEKVLQDIEIDMCFSFDVFVEDERTTKVHIKETIKYTAMTAGMQKMGLTIPIIHSGIKDFPEVINGVVEGINPQIIGITERELGATLIERATNLRKIRIELDKVRKEVPIHLLGTGNPISLLVYSLCGADLFDGLEWCKNVVNPPDAHLYHFIQKDLIKCSCKACKISNEPYHIQTMTHNLLFYKGFMEEIRQAIEMSKTSSLLQKYLPSHIIPQIEKLALRK